jgi:hypothetical protein
MTVEFSRVISPVEDILRNRRDEGPHPFGPDLRQIVKRIFALSGTR